MSSDSNKLPVELPLFQCGISAGFPSPADDFIEQRLNLNDLLIRHPSATFFVRVDGDSMKNAGIFSGDLLIVDRSLNAMHRDIVVAIFNGEFTVKRLIINRQKIFLVPENPLYPAIEVDESSFEVWGVVTYVIHKPS